METTDFMHLKLLILDQACFHNLFCRGRGREADVDRRGGVTYKEEQIKNMMELAAELAVTPPTVQNRLV